MDSTDYFIIGIIVVIIIFVLYKITKKSEQSKSGNKNGLKKSGTGSGSGKDSGTEVINYSINQWNNEGFGLQYGTELPKHQLASMIQKYGEPDKFKAERGGYAIWDFGNSNIKPFSSITLRDSLIPHEKPSPHIDCVETLFRVAPENIVPDKRWLNLDKITSAIHIGETYPESKEAKDGYLGIVVCCQSVQANTCIHWIANKYLRGEITLDEAVGMYGPLMTEILEDSHDVKYLELLSEL